MNWDRITHEVGTWTPIIAAGLYCVYMAANLMR